LAARSATYIVRQQRAAQCVLSRRSARAVHRRCGCGAQERGAALLVRPWDSRSPVSLRRDSAGVLKLGSPPRHQRRDSLLHRAACACARARCHGSAAQFARGRSYRYRQFGLSPFGFSVGARPPPLSFRLGRRDRLPAGVQRGGDGGGGGGGEGALAGTQGGTQGGTQRGVGCSRSGGVGGAAQRRRRDRKGVGGGRRSEVRQCAARCARVGPVLCLCVCLCVSVCVCVFEVRCALRSLAVRSFVRSFVRLLACLLACLFVCSLAAGSALCGAVVGFVREHGAAVAGTSTASRCSTRRCSSTPAEPPAFQRPLTP
jgi:hypothetical protein